MRYRSLGFNVADKFYLFVRKQAFVHFCENLSQDCCENFSQDLRKFLYIFAKLFSRTFSCQPYNYSGLSGKGSLVAHNKTYLYTILPVGICTGKAKSYMRKSTFMLFSRKFPPFSQRILPKTNCFNHVLCTFKCVIWERFLSASTPKSNSRSTLHNLRHSSLLKIGRTNTFLSVAFLQSSPHFPGYALLPSSSVSVLWTHEERQIAK